MQLARYQEMRARNLAFWRGAEADRPLLGAYVGVTTQPAIYAVAEEGEYLRPACMVAERFFEHIEKDCDLTEQLEIDLFMPAAPPPGVPWLEACLGMPIQVYRDAIWPHAILSADEPLESLQPAYDEEWIDALAHFMHDLVSEFAGRYPIAMPFLRGPIDVVAGMIGTDRACMEFYDHPHQMQRLIDVCAAAWQDISLRLQPIIPPFDGGYVCGGRWVWAPAPCTYSSEDSTTFLSASTYRQFLLPADQRIAATFPHGFVHRHSVSGQNMAGLLDINPGWAIEITVDPMGPAVPDLAPLLRELQAHGRRLIIFGLTTEADVVDLAQVLSPRGVCLIVQSESLDDGRRLLQAARRAWQGS
jgi:hypothetical protein